METVVGLSQTILQIGPLNQSNAIMNNSSSFDPTMVIISFFVGLGFIIIVFLALRALTLWYWKINVIVSNQEKLLRELKEISGLLIGRNGQTEI
jgi:hypothetical protein